MSSDGELAVGDQDEDLSKTELKSKMKKIMDKREKNEFC